MTELTKQDKEVLGKWAERNDFTNWFNVVERNSYDKIEIDYKTMQDIAILSRQATEERCLKEIEKREAKAIAKTAVKIWCSVMDTINEIEESFEGTAVEFCEKHGNAAYTGFIECLKELKNRLQESEK
jgi:hypothetical protein